MSTAQIAIVHDRFIELAGSERVVEQMHARWPRASIHAPLANPGAIPPGLRDADLRIGGLQRYFRGGPNYAYLLPFLPSAVARLDLAHAELVITSHHTFANRVRPPPGVPVVSYTHTPARWIWDPAFLAYEVGGTLGRLGLRGFAATQRRADRAAARRAAAIVVNSSYVATRVRRWWGLAAEVVAPPVDVDYYTPDPHTAREPFFLLAGRLVPYKRPELAVAAAVRAGVRLVVAGEGRMSAAVQAAAGPGVELLGKVDGATLCDLYRRCQALVFPGEEDFGIVPVEAQACGTPVLARATGGVLDTVVDGVTGTLYPASRPADEVATLADTLRAFRPERFDPAVIRRHAERFSPIVFATGLARVVDRVLSRA